jgi:hypothetical protein
MDPAELEFVEEWNNKVNKNYDKIAKIAKILSKKIENYFDLNLDEVKKLGREYTDATRKNYPEKEVKKIERRYVKMLYKTGNHYIRKMDAYKRKIDQVREFKERALQYLIEINQATGFPSVQTPISKEMFKSKVRYSITFADDIVKQYDKYTAIFKRLFEEYPGLLFSMDPSPNASLQELRAPADPYLDVEAYFTTNPEDQKACPARPWEYNAVASIGAKRAYDEIKERKRKSEGFEGVGNAAQFIS